MVTIIMPIVQNGEQRLRGNEITHRQQCYELYEGRIQIQVLALSPTR